MVDAGEDEKRGAIVALLLDDEQHHSRLKQWVLLISGLDDGFPRWTSRASGTIQASAKLLKRSDDRKAVVVRNFMDER